MRQLYRAHAVVFVCSYLGFLGYSALTDSHDPGATVLSRAKQRHAAPAPTPAIRRSTEKSVDAKVSVADAVSSPATPQDSTQHQERMRLSQAGLQATRAEEPQQRAEAIDQLNVATPEALQALQTVVTTDSAVRNRIRAVNSLRTLAQRDGAQDAVISILHLAMVDDNASVVSRANEVYRELTQEPAPAEQVPFSDE